MKTEPLNNVDPLSLKSKALGKIQEYGYNTWTDHNLHDPGIIILEQLCYALADFNYRTSFEMADLLERPVPVSNQPLFSPGSVLHNRPITTTDYRKLLLDVKGIKNAWVVPGKLRHPVYYNQMRTQLVHDPWRQEDHRPEDQLNVRGILDVVLAFDFDEDGNDLNSNKLLRELSANELLVAEFPRWDNVEVNWNDPDSILENLSTVKLFSDNNYTYLHELPPTVKETVEELIRTELIPEYQAIISKAHAIRDEVIQLLHQNRNMGQDFGEIRAVKSEDIGFTAEIEVKGDSDPEELYAELLARLNAHVAPAIHFYSLPELLERGMTMEEIYSGPALTHGFLLHDELPKQQPNLRTSDLINIMMDIPGIRAVKNFHAASYPEGVMFRSAQRWCVRLNPDLNYSPRIAPEFVKVQFFVDGMPGILNLNEALSRFRQKQIQRTNNKYRLDVQTNPVQEPGTYRELDKYYSIQKEFPANFGIGEEGLSADATVARRSQAHQLKSYLMVFEQMMANYSSQLSALPEIFSLNEAVAQTLFSQLPTDVPGLEQLMIDLSDAKDPDAEQKLLSVIQNILETPGQFTARRNRMLNHLMARFGEDINTNALLKGRHENHPGITEIANKTTLLRSYPDISTNRGGAFNYLRPEEVTGFQKRVYLLAGIKDLTRKHFTKRTGTDAEGFHVVEHILLRPQCNDVIDGKKVLDEFLPVFTTAEDYWINDPYSSIISVIIPDWPDRFKDAEYRDYFEKLIHLQAPAELQVIIHWVNEQLMGEFETSNETWLNLLPQAMLRKPDYSSALKSMIAAMRPLFMDENPATPPPVVPENSKPVDKEIWKSNLEAATWYQQSDSVILQGTFFGMGVPGIPGKGQMLSMNTSLPGDAETVRLKFIPGNETYSESGLAFDIESDTKYKLLYYSDYRKTVVLANVEYGYATALLETEVKDLAGKEVRIEMTQRNGKLKLSQSSPGMIGSEFLVAGSGPVGNNRIGLYTRYSQHTRFTHLEFMDSENRNVIFSKQKTANDGQ